jgi:glutamate racemase
VRIALIDSGFGLLPTAGWLRHLRPDLDLDLVTDPGGMPWGPRPADWIVERVLAAARRALDRGAAAVVVPCNTASVTALVPLRAVLEPAVPVVGTVPAVKPAAADGEPFAVWATERTSGSDYQRGLFDLFAAPGQGVGVPCPGLADAVERAEPAAVRTAVALAAARTPERVRGVVLGCTHYPLVAGEIRRALPGHVRLYDSSRAVAGQTLRRLGLPEAPGAEPGDVAVFLSGEPGELPAAARSYPVGAALAAGGRVERAVLPEPVEAGTDAGLGTAGGGRGPGATAPAGRAR